MKRKTPATFNGVSRRRSNQSLRQSPLWQMLTRFGCKSPWHVYHCWLRLIAGIFALTNTVSRRTDRLKSLVEIHKEFPDPLNVDYALERIMLRELEAIDVATTPILKWDRRFRIASVVIAFSWYATVALHFLLHIGKNSVYGPISASLGFLIGAMLLIDTNVLSKRRAQFRRRYALRHDAIEELAQEAHEPPTETEPGDTGI